MDGIDLLEFGLEGLVGVDREAGSGDLEPGAGDEAAFEVVAKEAGDVVEHLHRLRRCGERGRG